MNNNAKKITLSILASFIPVAVFLLSQMLVSFAAEIPMIRILTEELLSTIIAYPNASSIDYATVNPPVELVTMIMNTVSFLAGITAVAILVVIIIARKKNPIKELNISKIKPLSALAIIGIAVGTSIVTSLAISLIPFPDSWLDSYEQNSSVLTEGNAVINFISVVIVAPIAEEIVFRAMSYKALKGCMPTVLAMTLSSLVFGILHGTLIWATYAFAIGMLLCWIYDRFNSVLANITLHFAFNLLGIYADKLSALPDLIVFAIIMLFLAVISPLCLFYILKTTKKNENAKNNDSNGNDSDISLLGMF